MKKLYTNIILAVMTALYAGIGTGCETDGKRQEFIYPEPKIEYINPERGYTGSLLAILGSDFGDRAEPVTVWISEVEAPVISCKDNMIIVRVPNDASTGMLSLKIWNNIKTDFAHYTVVDKPKIYQVVSDNSISQSFAVAGDKITISGSSFGDDPSACSVSVGAADAPVISVKDDEIVCEAPAEYGYGEVTVTINGFSTVGGRLLDPSYKGDITAYALANATQPFNATEDAQVGGYCIPTDWQFSENMYYLDGDSYSLKRMLYFDGEYDGGAIAFLCNAWVHHTGHDYGYNNCKMYQTTYLPAGTYQFTTYMAECISIGAVIESWFVAAKGDVSGSCTIPDMEGANGVAGWKLADESALFDSDEGGKSAVYTTVHNGNYDGANGNTDPSGTGRFKDVANPIPYSFTAKLTEAAYVNVGYVVSVYRAGNGGDVFFTGMKVERIK